VRLALTLDLPDPLLTEQPRLPSERTWHVIATSWFTGRRRVLSSHFGMKGQLGAEVAALELLSMQYSGVEVLDEASGRVWRP
jgi:hypothetical protein